MSALAILPVVLHWPAASPRLSRTSLAWEAASCCVVLICWLIYRAEARKLPRRLAFAATLTVLLLSLILSNVHNYNVDRVTNLFPSQTNEDWQETLQNNVINLRPDVAPHSYRFLPNGIVRWMEIRHVSFRAAADIYRLISGVLLFYAIYRFASLFTGFPGAMLAMLLVAAVAPVSFEFYAGQLTDPISHLSFVLAFIFLETQDFPLLLATLLIGSLAKETILSLAGYYVLFCGRQHRYPARAITLCAAALVSYFGVRYFVLHGTMRYQNISGVSISHVIDNVKTPNWESVLFLTAFGCLFFMILGWNDAPASLKRLYFYLMPVLLVSSLFFSWLDESRNYMPLVVILAVIAGKFITEHHSQNWSRPSIAPIEAPR